jgi:hypothetical protein
MFNAVNIIGLFSDLYIANGGHRKGWIPYGDDGASQLRSY